MIQKVKAAATHIGVGIVAVYMLFLIPDVVSLFKMEHIIVLRQVLVIGFAVCLFVNPRSLAEHGEKLAPKIKLFLNLFTSSKNEDEKDNDT